MNSLGPLDTMDPNIPSRQPIGKLQPAQQPTSRAPPPCDRKGSEAPVSGMATNAAEGQSHVTRPSLASVPSCQRPRKRVIWRNKACFIALPLEDEFGRKTSRESYLSPTDFERRLEDWKNHGFDTNGFTLVPQTSSSHSPRLEGQSRAVHPDPEDEKRERADGTYHVNIPDRRHWETYVNHLKEEKLRALGVDEQTPRNSPALSMMSRQGSSQSSRVLSSPALASPTHVGPFPASFYGAANPTSYMGKPGVSHFPRYSIAHPTNESSLMSSNQFPQPSEPHIPATSSPWTYFTSQQGSRVASPGVNGYVQTFGHAAPSASPVGIGNVGQVSNQASADLLARMREQQALLQIQQLQQQQQQQHYQQQLLQQRSLPSLGTCQNGERVLQPVAHYDQADIATPIPRGHRQNPSENLQKGVDEADAHVSYSKDENEGQVGSKAAQIDEGYNEYQAKDIPNNAGRAARHNARANGSVLDASLSVRGIPDHETNDPGQSQSRYPSKVSQFNVNAPKFEPGVSKSSGTLSYLGDKQARALIETQSLSFPSSDGAMQAPSGASLPSKWNVAAPTFMPNSSVMATLPSREFSFSASRPSFRPDAPAFSPSDGGSTFGPKPASGQNAVQPVKKIFGDINFSEVIRPPKSKAIPITKPNKDSERQKKYDGDMDGQEDESGRITQADGRQKRMRRERDDGDQVTLFALSEGKNHWMDRGSEDRAACFSRTPSPESKAVDATTLDAATDLLEGLIDELSATEASDLMREESVDEDGERREDYIFNDLGEAASFNAARPPDPHEVARATRDFLGESAQFGTEFNRVLGHRTSSSRSSSCSSTKDGGKRYERKPQGGAEDSVDRIDHAGRGTHAIIMNGVRYVEPSYNELDAVMKHLNREDSDLGVERQPSPLRGRSPSASPIRYTGPKLHDSLTPHQLLPPANIRSDAPSPSPNRLQGNYQYLPPTDSESANPSLVEMVARSARYSPSYRPSKTSPPIHPLHSPGSTPPSDLDDAISSLNEDNFPSKTTMNNSVTEVMETIVQRELKPLEQALSGIQQSLAQLSGRSASRRPRSSGGLEIEHSDADDEDDVGEVSQSRLKSPLRDRKFEQLKASLTEITAAQQSLAPASQLAEMMAAVNGLKASIHEDISPPPLSGEIKNIVEEAVGRQMRGRSAPVTSSSQAAAAEKSQLQIAGLESMLKIADTRANDEMQARRSVEDELADKARLLRIALQEASEQRESAEATERSLRDFHANRQQTLQRTAMLEGSQESLQKTASDLSEKNLVLEETLSEYRLSSDQWRSEISDAKHENKDLRRTISSLNAEIEENGQGRRALRAKVDHLQGEIATNSRNVASDHLRWRSKEEEHQARLEILHARLETEARTRERLELDIERIEAQESEVIKTRSMVEQTQKANAHLQSLLAELRSECHHYQSVITRLRPQIDLVTTDADRSRSRYEQMLKEATDSRSKALGEAAHFYERSVKEMKAQHERILNNALEDKQRSETYFGNQLSLADAKVVHYQDRVSHLEEKLQIAKSAAHAAVQAAQSKKAVLGPSSSRTSLPIAKASEREPLPEKTSPQALRESILVLQEQLQERENRIEQLEYQLSSVDSNAPEKLRDAQIEITWLRELLGIRIEDLDDLIATVSQPSYNPESVKDAATRLKANLQMEQQEKERALASFPSLARISTIAASPKALPLAAAAAWGNWRKGRDSAFSTLPASQTLSKSSPQSFFAGLMTSPSTEMRTTPSFGDSRVYPSPSKRSVRAPTTPKQSLPRQEEPDRPLRRQSQQNPMTPPLMRKGSYDLDASEGNPFGDVAVENKMVAGDEEPFGPNLGGTVGGM
ncbi:hypothetical protein HO173_007450 [Letharia columbiana]|uniref:Uncharacterized protein n=1 Tax=Letharia columbiana TaxID=112416 RepID=A0A8H6FTF9_9LECA|nr:uncharacterized protein HO173_007450 [Letharia columbiana]KAF6234417.1 hypothetical protein HO173_007450 [Letharia columbiana]